MRILAIETSCDETALALVDASGGLRAPKFKILKEIVASQIKIHRPFGGVVPNLGKREHLKNLPLLYRKIFGPPTGGRQNEKSLLEKIDFIAVTTGPGLEPALWAGITYGQELAKKFGKPLVGANHLEGHLYSFLLPKTISTRGKNSKIFPAVALIVSGGHTILLYGENIKKWQKLGETRDDAAGEAYDKVARILGLPYPGGPEIEKLAQKGDPHAIEFPRPMLNQKNYDFSFSGLKTAVLYYLRKHNPGVTNFRASAANAPRYTSDNVPRDKSIREDVAASFEQAAIDVLVGKTIRAAREFGVKSILLSGGVAANSHLRREFEAKARKSGMRFLVADMKYNTDNAVIIAAAGYLAVLRKKKYPLRANGNLNI